MIQNDRFISVNLEIGISTAWNWLNNKPEFPRATKLSPRCTRWSLSVVNSFANSLKAKRH